MGKMSFKDVPTDGGPQANPLPPGWYQMVIERSALEPSSKPEAGRMLSLVLRIDPNVHPEFANRCAFTRLCWEHEKQTPREIAMRQLSQIVHSIPRLAETCEFDPEEPEDLIGETLMARLKVKPAKGDFEARNDIVAFAAVGAEQPNASAEQEAKATTAQRSSTPPPKQPPSGMNAGQQAPKSAATGMKAPWGKK